MPSEAPADWTRGPVADVMTRDAVCVLASDTMATVRRVLDQSAFHHLPVVESAHGPLVGMISVRNLALASVLECAPHGHACTARDVMTADPATLRRDDTLAAAAFEMLERRVGALPVVDGAGSIQGIVTRADLLRALAARR